ncbi:MAG: ankyrin repeat domain-containing protein [Acidobacteriota bacterium]|nr:ankyrin repeat domain-containing protein [Acidobacteriota bacterium]
MRTPICLVLLLVGAVGSAWAADVPLVDAVRAGDVEQIRMLLESATDPNTADLDGTTALHWAANRDDLTTAQLLIEAGAQVSVANRYGATPLMVAATNGNAPMLELLLKMGARANASLPEGETALMRSARAGRADAVRVLLSHAADVNAAEDWRGQTALMWATVEGNTDAVLELVAGGADVHARSAGGFTPLLFAVRHNQQETLKVLVAAGGDVNDTLPSGMGALALATLNAHYDLGVWLLEHGADPNASEQGWMALHQLVWARRPNLGFNNPAPIPTGLASDLDFVTALAAHGADLNALETKEPRGADGSGTGGGYRNVLNRVGATPFLLASKAADTELMQHLVRLGADPLLANEDGTTPLMVAAGVGIWAVGESPGTNAEALEAVKLMLELGDSVTTVDANGDTALHGAIIRGSEPLVRFLLDQGADLEAVNGKGWTPLTIAEGVFYSNTGKRWPEMEKLLVELGARRGSPAQEVSDGER